MTFEPFDHQAYWPLSLSSSLSTIEPIEPIDHRAYVYTMEPIYHGAYPPSSLFTSSLLSQFLSLFLEGYSSETIDFYEKSFYMAVSRYNISQMTFVTYNIHTFVKRSNPIHYSLPWWQNFPKYLYHRRVGRLAGWLAWLLIDQLMSHIIGKIMQSDLPLIIVNLLAADTWLLCLMIF